MKDYEFRRIPGLPPYVFTIIDGLKTQARREPARTSSTWGSATRTFRRRPIAVEKLAEAAHNTPQPPLLRGRGHPQAAPGRRRPLPAQFGVELDPDTEVVTTIGAKEGFSHLMWVLLQPG